MLRTRGVFGTAEEVVDDDVRPWVDFYDHGILQIKETPPGSMMLVLGEEENVEIVDNNGNSRVFDQWRICFRFMDGEAYDVEITEN